MNDLSNPIPIIAGHNAFDCPDCHTPMAMRKAIPTPEGCGIGIWVCADCRVIWTEDGDEWYRAEGRKQQ